MKKRMTYSIEKSSLLKYSICKSHTQKMRYQIARCNDKSCNAVEQCQRVIKILTVTQIFWWVKKFRSNFKVYRRGNERWRTFCFWRRFWRQVFGITDLQRQFHPICFIITSHETEQDYDHFFDSLKDVCQEFEFNFEQIFICIDAWSATANSVSIITFHLVH